MLATAAAAMPIKPAAKGSVSWTAGVSHGGLRPKPVPKTCINLLIL
jgi:hypothetical protein